MKKYFVYFLFILFIASCEKIEDDSDLICTTDCSTISGKVYTQSNIPLKNVMVKFRHQKSVGTYQLNTRLISAKRTNASGEYTMSFFLNDDELGETAGSFDLYVDQNTVPKNVFYPLYAHLFSGFWEIENRNFNAQKDLYIPTPRKTKIILQNFNSAVIGDYFSAEIILPCGFDKTEVDLETGNNHRYVNTGINKHIILQNMNITRKEFIIDLALNELNYIVLVRNENGIYSREVLPIFVTTDTSEVLTYNF